MNSTMNIPGLEDVIVTRTEEINGIVHIHVEMAVKPHRCPKCDRMTSSPHDYYTRNIKHLKWFERPTKLFYRQRRYKCECNKKIFEDNPFVEKYQRFSIELNQAITIRSIKGKNFKETADIYGVSSSTVVWRFDKAAKSVIKSVEQLPIAIAIDEYKGDTREVSINYC